MRSNLSNNELSIIESTDLSEVAGGCRRRRDQPQPTAMASAMASGRNASAAASASTFGGWNPFRSGGWRGWNGGDDRGGCSSRRNGRWGRGW